MPKPKTAVEKALDKWTFQELMAVKHLGPGLIGQEMYDASQKLSGQTGGGVFGPAILGVITDQNRDLSKKDEPEDAA